ncbi:hypothetical protein GTP45_25290 [Pseudoduganella sp. FT55W]|uniref:Calcium-binding protein n=1 Tax=Duganella rivi TaxID=2666083 RepID=A0A7X4GWZ4_9BURK|nr:hypothetical protein [Duganella rivi]
MTANAFGPGGDSVEGTSGNDLLDGGPGADTLAGGAGYDIYFVDNVDDVVVELDNQGYDTIRVNLAAGSTYTVPAHIEDARLSGHNAVNLLVGADNTGCTLTGNDAANLLTGGSAGDYLRGGGGADTLDGAGGFDIVGGLDNVGDYTIVQGEDGAFLLTSVFSGATITARNIESFQFSDATYLAADLATMIGVQLS